MEERLVNKGIVERCPKYGHNTAIAPVNNKHEYKYHLQYIDILYTIYWLKGRFSDFWSDAKSDNQHFPKESLD